MLYLHIFFYFQVIVEYGAISECSDSLNDSRFEVQPMVSALNILDNVTRQKTHLIISSSKLSHQSNEATDAASLVLLKIAKLFGNSNNFFIKYFSIHI